MALEQRLVTQWRVVCQAGWEPSERGCAGFGRWAEHRVVAEDLAIMDGWKWCSSETGVSADMGSFWVCPGHFLVSFGFIKEEERA